MTAETMYPTGVDFATIDEIRECALAAMPPDLADFLEGGAGSETTLRANRESFSRYRILPEPMSGVASPDTATSILGIDLAVPILIAPFGGDGLFHPDGHLAVARAAAAAGIVDIVPEAGSFAYEAVRAVAPSGARVAQLHPFDDAESSAARLVDAGFEALCVTVDCPTGGFRTRNLRNRFAPEMTAFAGNVVEPEGDAPHVAEVMGKLLNSGQHAWSWADITAMTEQLPIPWIAKGILTPRAARHAVDAGASAIVVSNHGGRQVDPAPAAIDMLPAVRAVVGVGCPIVLDSGIRSGADIFIALAAGADAVIIGRPAVHGLAAGGQRGVERVIELMADELRILMTLAGAARISDITGERVLGTASSEDYRR